MTVLPLKWLKNFKIQPENYKIILNMIWLFLDKLINRGGAFLVMVLIARYLGTEKFGLWNYAIAFVTFFGVLTSLGLQNIVVRELLILKYKRNEIIGSAFFLKILGSLFTITLSIGVIYILNPEDSILRIIVFIISISYLFKAFDVVDYYFQAETDSKFTVIPKTIAFMIAGCLNILLIINDMPLTAFVIVGAVEVALAGVFMLITLWKFRRRLLKWRINKHVVKELLYDGFPLIFAEVAVLIYMKIDQIMIGEMISKEAVGNFSAAVRLSEMWLLIPFIITRSVFPKIMHTKAIDPKIYHLNLQRLFNLLTAIGVAAAILISFFGSFIINFVFGEQYVEASSVLVIHIWSAVFAFIGFVSSLWFTAEKLQKYILYRTCAGAVVNFVLNLILISELGITGAAIATLVSQFVASYFFNLFTGRTRIIFKMQSIAILNVLTLGNVAKIKNLKK